MKASLSAAILIACLLVPQLSAAADAAGEKASSAPALFEQALAADADGNTALRDKLLHQALRVDPGFELAHWQLGQVYFQGQWRSIDTIGQLVSHDPRWQEYRQRLAASDGSPAANAALARWCDDQRLENEAKLHWYQVLTTDADNREALGNLGLNRYHGGLYTDEQIAELEQSRAQAEKDFKRYRREFKRLVKSAERVDEQQRDEALAQLSAVSDPAAIEALKKTLVAASGSEKHQEFNERVCEAVVTALSGMNEYSSTLKLVEIAVFAPQESVRHSAAAALRYREPTDFMPLLMASLAAPVESTFSIEVLPSGHVSLVENQYEEGPVSAKSRVRSSNYVTQKLVTVFEQRRFDPVSGKELPRKSTTSLISDPVRDYGKAIARVRQSGSLVTLENQARFQRNARIQEVLEIVTERNLGSDPKAWWTAWQEYNDLYTPDELPVDESYDYQISHVIYRPASCFIAGTPVWTQSGPQPIEQIAVGELVLSQDPLTGKLDYRPVVGTTIRPPTGVVELEVNGEKIVATRGHRFWVTGEGWRMAKFLNPGSELFSARGSRELSSVNEADDEVAYNLVVGEYHTYFVGESRLLVHDNNCPLPVTATVPGAAN